jgi:hypothetical protein
VPCRSDRDRAHSPRAISCRVGERLKRRRSGNRLSPNWNRSGRDNRSGTMEPTGASLVIARTRPEMWATRLSGRRTRRAHPLFHGVLLAGSKHHGAGIARDGFLSHEPNERTTKDTDPARTSSALQHGPADDAPGHRPPDLWRSRNFAPPAYIPIHAEQGALKEPPNRPVAPGPTRRVFYASARRAVNSAHRSRPSVPKQHWRSS